MCNWAFLFNNWHLRSNPSVQNFLVFIPWSYIILSKSHTIKFHNGYKFTWLSKTTNKSLSECFQHLATIFQLQFTLMDWQWRFEHFSFISYMHIASFYNVLLLQAILEFVIESPGHDLFKSLFLITVLVK